MEASRSHLDQLPFDAEEEHPSVRAIDDRIVIESLTVTDERAAKVVRERHEAGVPAIETVAKAIEIGARVIDSESTATNVDYVQHEFEKRMGRLGAEMEKQLEDGSKEIAERISENFDDERADSVQGQIKTMLQTAIQFQQAELTKMLTAEDASNPLVAMQIREQNARREADERHKGQMTELKEASENLARALVESHQKESHRSQKEIAGLKEQLSVLLERQAGDAALAEAEEAGTRKGFTFEERVHGVLEDIADGFGDVARHTGAETGAGGTKKGDTVVEIGASSGPCLAKIVFEDKDRKLSKNEAWTELDAAMAEREASYGVLVVAGEENVPSGREELHEYQGNKLIIAVDPEAPDGLALKLVYRYVRLRLLAARNSALEVDAGGVLDAAESATAALKRAQAVRLSLTNIDKSSKKAREGLEDMVAAVEADLTRIESLVADAAEADTAEDPAQPAD
ncbi:MAG: hypothetical protein KDB58_02910 [Solirubrobacterales bacterium]|nr:hypothetical protein [Solirubrobacterales bacterium]MCB8969655.1 hypothetical protein [Thermoleophilales bacterium]MCO5327930.1 hypothetical protein [Solirubrobacterales bacterium]